MTRGGDRGRCGVADDEDGEQLADIRAGTARIGHARTALKHGARFIIARFVNIAGVIFIVLGLTVIAAAFYWV